MGEKPLEQHSAEIAANAQYWNGKPLLKRIYMRFHKEIAQALGTNTGKDVLELGSGIGSIKLTLPECITSDIFENPWLDRVENAYSLNFPDCSLNGIILFDVWHHLEYPGTALKEFSRVLRPSGKVILFEPAMGLLGRLVYGCFHHEPLGFGKPINWELQSGLPELRYYAAQANSWRAFHLKTSAPANDYGLKITQSRLYSAITYIAAGGFSKPQLYPAILYSSLLALEQILDAMPSLFATRMLIVMKKQPTAK